MQGWNATTGHLFISYLVPSSVGEDCGTFLPPGYSTVHGSPREGMSFLQICILSAGNQPMRLALVTAFQFMENLTDRQAADAVRSRLDWKYAFGLELTDPGFDHTVLSEFRTPLVALTAEGRFLEAVLDLCKERGWLKGRGHQRTDSTHILAIVRALIRAECVVETLRHARSTLSCCRTGLATRPGPARLARALWLARH